MKTQFRKLFFLTIVSSLPNLSFATTYYVSGAGDDLNNGQTTTTAFRNIQTAANLVGPGDTVLVMTGIYNSFNINTGGNATNWVTFKNYPGNKPKIKFNDWSGIEVGSNVAYLEINGFEIEGNNANVTLADAQVQPGTCNHSGEILPAFNGDGINVDGRSATPGTQKPHHLRIVNNTIHDCGGAGIELTQSDYATIKNNKIYNNSYYTIFGTSGISLWQSWNFDNGPGYRNIIEANDVHNNRNFIPTSDFPVIGFCEFTDGNGIIIDDNKNTQYGSALGQYNGRTLIQNNKVYRNGGAGIHTYQSQHVDIINNTSYKNLTTPDLSYVGEIGPNSSNDIKIFNNILYAETNKPVNSNWGLSNFAYNNNLHFNGTAGSISCTNCVTADPKFRNEASSDFHLQSTSPAINKANSITYAKTDFDGLVRPSGTTPDIGAYKYTKPVINLLQKPDFESGTMGWTGLACSIVSSSIAHTGTQSVLTSDRTAAWAGPQQDITNVLKTKGQGNYLVEGWVKAVSGSIDSKITIVIIANDVKTWISTEPVLITTAWTKISNPFNLTWSGEITSAFIYVETTSGTTDFYTDDLTLE